MKAIILAGGRGTRLLPYTTVLPKPLMPVGDHAILDIILRQLRRSGVNDVVLAVGHLAQLLRAYFGDGKAHGVTITYSMEDEPLGTAGPLALVPNLDESFLVMNGDVLTTLDYGKMLEYHRLTGSAATVAVFPRAVQIDLGVVEFDKNFRLTEYIEKPSLDFWVSMGIYILEPRVLKLIARGKRTDLPDLMAKLTEEDESVGCFRHDGYWLDIGRPDDYERALAEFPKWESELLCGPTPQPSKAPNR